MLLANIIMLFWIDLINKIWNPFISAKQSNFSYLFSLSSFYGVMIQYIYIYDFIVFEQKSCY